MKTSLPSRLLVFLLVVAGVMLSPVAGHAQNPPADGQALYKTKCLMCHGADGAGKTPMGQKLNIRDLRSAEVQKESDSDLAHTIAQGKGKMPAFGQTFNDDQIKLLVAYIRELGKK